jgi:TonB family protein
MIKAHLRESPGLHIDQANKHGIVDFYLDEGGNLLGRRLVASSGSADLDIAVMNAITAAAPYPAPPNWSPVSLNYNFGRAPGGRGH